MLVSVVPIGNSRGIRLPKAILEQLNIQDKLELEVDDDKLVLKPVNKKPRAGWEDALQEMGAYHEDVLLIPEESASGAFEWEW